MGKYRSSKFFMVFSYFFFQKGNVVSINSMRDIVCSMGEPIVQHVHSSVQRRLESDDACFIITL